MSNPRFLLEDLELEKKLFVVFHGKDSCLIDNTIKVILLSEFMP